MCSLSSEGVDPPCLCLRGYACELLVLALYGSFDRLRSLHHTRLHLYSNVIWNGMALSNNCFVSAFIYLSNCLVRAIGLKSEYAMNLLPGVRWQLGAHLVGLCVIWVGYLSLLQCFMWGVAQCITY